MMRQSGPVGRGVVLLVTLGAVTLPACAAKQRERPLSTTRIESGPNTVESVRAALQGKWVLVSLNMNAEDGRSAPVEATGILTSDQFGGLNVEYRLSDQGRQTLA